MTRYCSCPFRCHCLFKRVRRRWQYCLIVLFSILVVFIFVRTITRLEFIIHYRYTRILQHIQTHTCGKQQQQQQQKLILFWTKIFDDPIDENDLAPEEKDDLDDLPNIGGIPADTDEEGDEEKDDGFDLPPAMPPAV